MNLLITMGIFFAIWLVASWIIALSVSIIVGAINLRSQSGKLYEARILASLPQNVKSPVIPDKGLLGHIGRLYAGENGCIYNAVEKMVHEYGPVIQLDIVGNKWLVISDQRMIQHILTDRRQQFPKTGDIVDEIKAMFGDKMLIVTEGSEWLRQRQLCMPAFRLDRLKEMMVEMNSVARIAVDGLVPDETFDAHELANRIGFAVICQVGFDYRVAVYGNKSPMFESEEYCCEQLLIRVQRTKFWKKLPLPSNFKLKEMLLVQRQLLQEVIDNRAPQAENARILLDLFKTAASEEGQTLCDEELIQLVQNFVIAGFETTATLIMWTLYYLAENPQYQNRVREEIKTVVGHKQDIEYDDYKQLAFLEKVINETLRLRPGFPFIIRACAEDTELCSWHIPKGSAVNLNLRAVHMNPEIWGDDVDRFNPHRFDEDKIAARPLHHFLPFGMGPRVCIGHRFTMMEAMIVIGQFVRQYHFELEPGQNLKPFLKLVWGVKAGMKMRAVPT